MVALSFVLATLSSAARSATETHDKELSCAISQSGLYQLRNEGTSGMKARTSLQQASAQEIPKLISVERALIKLFLVHLQSIISAGKVRTSLTPFWLVPILADRSNQMKKQLCRA